MALPELNQQELNSVIIAQKKLHRGTFFSAIHNGNSIIALDEKFAIKITKISEYDILVDLVRYAIKTVAHTNVVFKRKEVKKTKHKVSKRKVKISKGVTEL